MTDKIDFSGIVTTAAIARVLRRSKHATPAQTRNEAVIERAKERSEREIKAEDEQMQRAPRAYVRWRMRELRKQVSE